MRIGDFIHVEDEPAAAGAPTGPAPVADLRFYRMTRSSPLRLMCPNCREGGLRTTYGDDRIAGCSNCSAKWNRAELDRYNDNLLVSYEIRKEDPDGGPLKDWMDRMKARRKERLADQRSAEEQERQRRETQQAQMRERNALERGRTSA